MSEGKLSSYWSTTSLSVVWTTKEIENKNNNNNQHHQHSRRRQFFTTSFSFLSPFLTPSSHQLYLWSGGSSLEYCLKELGWKEVEFNRQGLQFKAFHMNHGQKILSAAPRSAFTDKINKLLIARFGAPVTGGFDVKRILDIYVAELVEKSKITKKKQYKKKVNLNSRDPAFLEMFIASQFDHPNIVTPQAFVLADSETGKTCRSLYSFTLSRREVTGNIKKFADLLLLWNKSVELREVILSQIIKGALEGLEHIHSKGFVYGHFDPSNIIVCEDQKSLTNLTGKLTGFARSCKSGPLFFKLGTSSPECRRLNHVVNHPSVDLWALGSCLFFLFTGEHFRDSTKLNDSDSSDGGNWRVRDDFRMKKKNLSLSLRCLIKDLLDPKKKFNCSDVLNSQWMKYCDNLFSQNKEMKNEISEIIKVVKSGVQKESRIIDPSRTSVYDNLPSSKQHDDNKLSAGCSSSQSSNESLNEFENRETQLSDEIIHQSSGSQKSLLGNNSFDSDSEDEYESECSPGQLNHSNRSLSSSISSILSSASLGPSLTSLQVPNSNTAVQSKSNFNSSALSTVATTSDDIPVKKIRGAISLSPTKNKFDPVIRRMKDTVHHGGLNLRTSHYDNELSSGCSSSNESLSEFENLETELCNETSYQTSAVRTL